MIETPSLRLRVTVGAVVVVALLVVGLEAFVYLSLRERLTDTLGEVLDSRAALVLRLAEDAPDLATLDDELTELGVPAVLRAADGAVVRSEPAARRFDVVPPGSDGVSASESRTVPLADGASAEVFVARGGVDSTLRRVLLVEFAGSVAAILIAGAMLVRVSSLVTRPLDRMVSTALVIAAGDRSQRLDPSDPTTELGRMAAAFDEMIDGLQAALTEAEEAEQRSRRFLADAAHQLRTPLAGLRASAEVLLDRPDGPDREEMAANVAAESARLSRLVERLLRVARLDRGEEPKRRPVDLLQLAETETERQRALAPRLRFDVIAASPSTVAACDPDATREALANLLDNARRFAAHVVEVHVSSTLGMVTVTVRDDGPGVAPDMEDEVFERFVTSEGGSGLGLPIARGIAEAHGGEVGWRDGAFVLELPRAPIGI